MPQDGRALSRSEWMKDESKERAITTLKAVIQAMGDSAARTRASKEVEAAQQIPRVISRDARATSTANGCRTGARGGAGAGGMVVFAPHSGPLPAGTTHRRLHARIFEGFGRTNRWSAGLVARK